IHERHDRALLDGWAHPDRGRGREPATAATPAQPREPRQGVAHDPPGLPRALVLRAAHARHLRRRVPALCARAHVGLAARAVSVRGHGGLLGAAHSHPAPGLRQGLPAPLPRGGHRLHRRRGLPRDRLRKRRAEVRVSATARAEGEAARGAAVRGAVSGVLAGALAWIILVASGAAGLIEVGTIEALLALAPLVVVPLALEARRRLAEEEPAPAPVAWVEGIARLVVLPAALFAAASL